MLIHKMVIKSASILAKVTIIKSTLGLCDNLGSYLFAF